MRLHRRKIAVIVQQRMAPFDAEGADDDVGGLADRDAQFSQLAIVAGGTLTMCINSSRRTRPKRQCKLAHVVRIPTFTGRSRIFPAFSNILSRL
jgi:hypothetical protein